MYVQNVFFDKGENYEISVLEVTRVHCNVNFVFIF